jgi:hypothetical protein
LAIVVIVVVWIIAPEEKPVIAKSIAVEPVIAKPIAVEPAIVKSAKSGMESATMEATKSASVEATKPAAVKATKPAAVKPAAKSTAVETTASAPAAMPGKG